MLTHLPTLTVLLPLMGALLASVLGYLLPLSVHWRVDHGRKHGAEHGFSAHDFADWASMLICTGGVIAAAVCGWMVFLGLHNGTMAPDTVQWLEWLKLSGWSVGFGAMTDKLTATMFIVVTTVSACVHVYSIAYMAEDDSRRRFFIYLSFFTFAMLMLVSAPNLLQMFVGWEGVGVCSYLLIGFWHHKESANAAAMKAFIVNRVADAAMLLGMFTLLMSFNTLNYGDLFGQLATTQVDQTTLNMAALLIFIGRMGKSAQFGLHTWLPDAMEGPTPVSALIHAATMVTAGVFLLCRLSPLYELTPDVLHIVGWVGAITAIFAATVGLTQTDIKRVIAYSTCSQLGYMFFAIGVSAYPAAMFHLTTHAFFKALLFLGAGSVIHAMHHEQDIRHYGGLKTVLPITYGLMWLGSLALAGIPPFAGFFSKDLILESAFMAPNGVGVPLYVAGTIGAFMTAIYGFRIVFRTFDGTFTGDKDTLHHAHESPWLMRAPMLLLAVGAVASGYMLHHHMGSLAWWNGAIVIAHAHNALEAAHHIAWFPKYLPLVLAISGVALSFYLFAKRRDLAAAMAREANVLHAISLNKWYIDEIYDVVVVKPVSAISQFLSKVIDQRGIDGIVNGVAADIAKIGTQLRRTQTGHVAHYALAMIVAIVLALGWLVWGV